MTKIELQNLLQQPYDQYLFATKVLKNIFGNRFELYAMPQSVSPPPTQNEKKTIDLVQIYGEITLDNGTTITCYEIKLQPQVRIEQSRVAIQQYIRKLTFTGSGALVNFISPKTPNTWRLTYIAKDSIVTENGVKMKPTYKKRYTYLLGKDETCKTVAERLSDLGNKPAIDIEALTNAFSVEKLSKAFFDEYKNHYDKFVGHLVASNFKKSVFNGDEKAIRDFCKKLLGRIVFLYFVQKKGWLGATDTEYTDGNRDFITHLFDSAQVGDAFYALWLSKLFFEALNQERKGDSFEMPTGEKLKIPFLNGGLFEKETHDDTVLTLKADLFRASNPFDMELPNKRGFLDFLNAYNFTIHEDSPDDHTVAVDPEMLGHIFENLLEDNKDKGAFYTPKEIVQYMCRESLAEYLATQCPTIAREAIDTLIKQHETALPAQDLHAIDAKLDVVKICDPAIGSGAFPMGLLHEIFSLKELIAYQVGKEWKPAKVKANIIQNCIYGVDIEKGAVDIARLRFWLSLIVDEPKPKALPNLDYKIVVGNSLVGKFGEEIVEIDWDNKKSTSSSKEFVKNIQTLLKDIAEKQKEYFVANTSQKKSKFKQDIRTLKIDLLTNQITLNKIKYEQATPKHAGFQLSKKEATANSQREEQIDKFDKLLQKLQGLKKNPAKELDFFEWKLDFPDVLNPNLVEKEAGFDIVIGNPPYVGEKGNKNIFEPLKVSELGKRFYEGKMDLFYFFFHLGLDLSREKGVMALITTNYFITATHATKLRNDIKERSTVIHFLNFNEFKIFESALGQHNLISILQKGNFDTFAKTTIVNAKGFLGYDVMNSITNGNSNEATYYTMPQHSLYNNGNIVLTNNKIDNILDIINTNINLLGDICNVSVGLRTGIDKISNNHLKHQNDLKLGDSVFVIQKDELVKFDGELTMIKKMYKNSNIKKYLPVSDTDLFVIYTKSSTNIDKFKKIKEHLLKFKFLIEKIRENDGEIWYSIVRPRNEEIFISEKIVVPQRSSENTFTYHRGELYASSDVYFITHPKETYTLKYLLGVLNSKLIYTWLYYRGKRKGETLELYQEPLSKIPIKYANSEVQEKISMIVDYILHLKTLPATLLQSSFFEQLIDGMVYELYFPELLKEHKREVMKHLGDLPAIDDTMTDAQKMSVITSVYERLSANTHPVKTNLFYMDSIPEIALIEGKNS